MIYLGCSGWSYPEWIGPLYRSASTDKLAYYSTVFNTVEINTTFYSIPDFRVVSSWMKRVADRNFRFSVKFPGAVTHRNLVTDPDQAVMEAVRFQNEYLAPMRDNGSLAAVLIQLPPYFAISNAGNLLRMLKALSTSEFSYFIEPRHSTLYGNIEFQGDVLDTGAEIVEIDSPEMALKRISSRSGSFYARLHGRNSEMWKKRTENPSDRYDYEYSRVELGSIADIIRGNVDRFRDAFIYFNNHPGGKAPMNALSLSGMLGLEKRDPQTRLF